METIPDYNFYPKLSGLPVLNFNQTEDRVLTAVWAERLKEDLSAAQEIKLNYIRSLLFVLRRGKLASSFDQHELIDVAEKIIEEENEDKLKKREKQIHGESGDFSSYVSEFPKDTNFLPKAKEFPNWVTNLSEVSNDVTVETVASSCLSRSRIPRSPYSFSRPIRLEKLDENHNADEDEKGSAVEFKDPEVAENYDRIASGDFDEKPKGHFSEKGRAEGEDLFEAFWSCAVRRPPGPIIQECSRSPPGQNKQNCGCGPGGSSSPPGNAAGPSRGGSADSSSSETDRLYQNAKNFNDEIERLVRQGAIQRGEDPENAMEQYTNALKEGYTDRELLGPQVEAIREKYGMNFGQGRPAQRPCPPRVSPPGRPPPRPPQMQNPALDAISEGEEEDVSNSPPRPRPAAAPPRSYRRTIEVLEVIPESKKRQGEGAPSNNRCTCKSKAPTPVPRPIQDIENYQGICSKARDLYLKAVRSARDNKARLAKKPSGPSFKVKRKGATPVFRPMSATELQRGVCAQARERYKEFMKAAQAALNNAQLLEAAPAPAQRCQCQAKGETPVPRHLTEAELREGLCAQARAAYQNLMKELTKPPEPKKKQAPALTYKKPNVTKSQTGICADARQRFSELMQAAKGGAVPKKPSLPSLKTKRKGATPVFRPISQTELQKGICAAARKQYEELMKALQGGGSKPEAEEQKVPKCGCQQKAPTPVFRPISEEQLQQGICATARSAYLDAVAKMREPESQRKPPSPQGRCECHHKAPTPVYRPMTQEQLDQGIAAKARSDYAESVKSMREPASQKRPPSPQGRCDCQHKAPTPVYRPMSEEQLQQGICASARSDFIDKLKSMRESGSQQRPSSPHPAKCECKLKAPTPVLRPISESEMETGICASARAEYVESVKRAQEGGSQQKEVTPQARCACVRKAPTPIYRPMTEVEFREGICVKARQIYKKALKDLRDFLTKKGPVNKQPSKVTVKVKRKAATPVFRPMGALQQKAGICARARNEYQQALEKLRDAYNGKSRPTATSSESRCRVQNKAATPVFRPMSQEQLDKGICATARESYQRAVQEMRDSSKRSASSTEGSSTRCRCVRKAATPRPPRPMTKAEIREGICARARSEYKELMKALREAFQPKKRKILDIKYPVMERFKAILRSELKKQIAEKTAEVGTVEEEESVETFEEEEEEESETEGEEAEGEEEEETEETETEEAEEAENAEVEEVRPSRSRIPVRVASYQSLVVQNIPSRPTPGGDQSRQQVLAVSARAASGIPRPIQQRPPAQRAPAQRPPTQRAPAQGTPSRIPRPVQQGQAPQRTLVAMPPAQRPPQQRPFAHKIPVRKPAATTQRVETLTVTRSELGLAAPASRPVRAIPSAPRATSPAARTVHPAVTRAASPPAQRTPTQQMPRGRFDRVASPPTPEDQPQHRVLTVTAEMHPAVPSSQQARSPRQRRPQPRQEDMDVIEVVGASQPQVHSPQWKRDRADEINQQYQRLAEASPAIAGVPVSCPYPSPIPQRIAEKVTTQEEARWAQSSSPARGQPSSNFDNWRKLDELREKLPSDRAEDWYEDQTGPAYEHLKDVNWVHAPDYLGQEPEYEPVPPDEREEDMLAKIRDLYQQMDPNDASNVQHQLLEAVQELENIKMQNTNWQSAADFFGTAAGFNQDEGADDAWGEPQEFDFPAGDFQQDDDIWEDGQGMGFSDEEQCAEDEEEAGAESDFSLAQFQEICDACDECFDQDL